MAANNRGGGTGTADRHGVRTTMDAPWKNGANKGSQNSMNAPFNAPRAGGDNGMPTQVYDTSLKEPGRSTAFSNRDVLGTIKTNPKARTPR